MNPLDHNTVLTLGTGKHLSCLGVFSHTGNNLLIAQHLGMILVIQLLHTVDDLAFLQAAVPYSRQQGFPVLEAIFLHLGFHIKRLHDIGNVDALCLTVGAQHFLPLYDVFFLEFVLEPLVDFIFGLCALNQIQPVTAGSLGVLGGQYLYSVPVLDFIVYGDQFAVYTGADHLISHGGMHAVRKINGRAACRQSLHIPCRGKAVNRIGKQIQIAFQQIHEFLIIGHIPLPFQDLPQPGQFFFFLCRNLLAVRGFLVFPVGRYTKFRRLMHFHGTDLDFKRLTGASDNRRMQGLVHIGLRHGNIVLETSGYGFIHFMDNSQRSITILH